MINNRRVAQAIMDLRDDLDPRQRGRNRRLHVGIRVRPRLQTEDRHDGREVVPGPVSQLHHENVRVGLRLRVLLERCAQGFRYPCKT